MANHSQQESTNSSFVVFSTWVHFLANGAWHPGFCYSDVECPRDHHLRTHATFRPLKHRLIKKKVFGAAAGAVWITNALPTVIYILTSFLKFTGKSHLDHVLMTTFVSFFLFYLLSIIVSYSSVVIRIVCGNQLHHHGATSRERKLTKTLLITTVVSVLLTLPFLFFCIFFTLRKRYPLRIEHWQGSLFLSFLYFINSIANPIIYSFRITEFKGALYSVLRFRSQPQPIQVWEPRISLSVIKFKVL